MAMNGPAAEWKGITPGLVIVIGVIMTGLFAMDRFLAKLEHDEIRREASRLASDGDLLLAANRAKDAVAPYQRAHSLVRDDREYALGYAKALLTAGDLPRAQSTLREILDRRSNDARANLLMARTLIALNQTDDADSFYHRAIYGSWPDGATANQIRVRMELVDWLAKRQLKDELLAELVPLRPAAQHDKGMSRRIAQLFLVAGAPERSAAEYRALLTDHPDDAAAYQGLGQAELERGNYRAAERAFDQALRIDPSLPEIERRLRMIRAVIDLDPTPRRLSSGEKYRRSLQIVELCAEALRACTLKPAVDTPENLLQQAAQLRAKRVRETITNELSESRLSLAEDLWRARMSLCEAPPAQDDPVSVIMKKLIAQ